MKSGLDLVLLTLLSSTGVSVALSGFLVWLLRTWIGVRIRASIQAEYSEKLETLKIQLSAQTAAQLETQKAALKAQGDVELEKLRAQLAIAAAERNAQVGGLVQRRFDAIEAIYGQLLRFHQSVSALVSGLQLAGGPDGEQRARNAADAFDAFEAAYLPRKIFLPKHAADRIDSVRQRLVSSANLFNLIISQQQNMAEKWIEIEHRVSSEIPAVMRELEADLRRLMGDSNDVQDLTAQATSASLRVDRV